MESKLYDKARNVPTICSECGADFRCKTGEPGDCWCIHSPNMKFNYQLDGSCLCPNCLANGQLNELKMAREEKRAKREAQSLRTPESKVESKAKKG